MRVDTGEETFDVDRDANPIQHLLGALAGCLNSTATTVSETLSNGTDLGVRLESA